MGPSRYEDRLLTNFFG